MDSAEQYAYGRTCTWHGPTTFALPAVKVDWAHDASEPAFVCPRCALPLVVTTAEAFWATAAATEKAIPEYVAMLRWSWGKCFPDFTTMQDAYRQAMEGMV